jgi:hypothetical protein
MRADDRMAAVLVLGAIACWGTGAAAQQNLTLPDVAVTAPSVPPPSAKPNPYFGKSRVEEDKWPEIPCTASRIALATGDTCKKGPTQQTFEKGDAPRLAPAIQLQYCP